jgi:hypothetical protein
MGPARRSRREALLAVVLAGLGVAGVVALLASGVLRGGDASSARDEPTLLTDEPRAALRGMDRPRRPIPKDTVEVTVVSLDRQEPVADVDVRLRNVLRGDAGETRETVAENTMNDAAAPAASMGQNDREDLDVTGRTGADGRVRLSGDFPAFVELDSDAWDAIPAVVATEGGREVRFDVTPRTVPRATLLDETTGLPLVNWQLSPMSPTERPAGTEPPRTDGRGMTTWTGLRHLPGVVAASDGKRRLHAFLLYALPGRTEVRLAMPPVARTTRLRVVDAERRPVAGARAFVVAQDSGVFVETDERGEVELEYGARESETLVVTAPAHMPRRVEIDGRPEVVVMLEAVATRTFRVRRPDGSDVAAGTTLRGYAFGPASYGRDGTGRRFEGTVGPAAAGGAAVGVATIDGLPAGAFDAVLDVEGLDVLASVAVHAAAEVSAPIDVVAGAPRSLALHVVRGPSDGRAAEPVAGLLWASGPLREGCDAGESAAAARRQSMEEAVRSGRGDRASSMIVARTGPDVPFNVPSSDVPMSVEILAADGAYGCVTVAPQDPGGSREVHVAPTGPSRVESPTVILVEWDDGAPAALVELDVTLDEAPAARAGKPVHTMTDSSGAAVLSEREGRFVVTTTRPDGTRYAGDGPLQLPSPSTPLVRLRAVAR